MLDINNNNNYIESFFLNQLEYNNTNSDSSLYEFNNNNENTNNLNEYYNDENYENKNENKIIPHLNKPLIFKIIHNKNKKNKKRNFLKYFENLKIPKEKHLNVEKKKKRIQFQKNHIKTIYSYCHLEPPFDFIYLFNLIKEHQNNYSNYFNQKKSFHFIKDNKKNIKIVTFEEKKYFKNLNNNL